MQPVERAVFALSPDSPADGVTVVRVLADLDLASVATGERQLRAVLERVPFGRILVLEFTPGTFVCVRGLHLLVDFAHRLHREGGHLIACAPPWGLARMVEILELRSDLTIVASVHDAMRMALAE